MALIGQVERTGNKGDFAFDRAEGLGPCDLAGQNWPMSVRNDNLLASTRIVSQAGHPMEGVPT